MKMLVDLADRAILPDPLIRMGIRYLDKQRIKDERKGGPHDIEKRKTDFIHQMNQSPIAIETKRANDQHYEVPSAFFEKVLGKHLKYSGCFWPEGVNTLDEAEGEMLRLTCDRAEITDSDKNLRILELGCGWGSLTLWMAENFPNSNITGVSNSHSQKQFIESQCKKRGIENVTILTRDMNEFSTDLRFDRIISVEMFEHMRNWKQLLNRISSWLKPDGKLFIHVFTHSKYAYPFETMGESNWLGRYFFTGGMMPSDDLLHYFQDKLTIESHWKVNGQHYSKTAEAWLANMNAKKEELIPILEKTYGSDNAEKWFQRWRIFFMACSELWGFNNGDEWLVSHYRLRNK